MSQRSIFVFGSNRQGKHGKGAALAALRHHGAVYGQAEGLQGDSYAIITKELRSGHAPVTLQEIQEGVEKFLAFAVAHPEWRFVVTAIGCGLAGREPGQIAPMFRGAPANVDLPYVFQGVLARPA